MNIEINCNWEEYMNNIKRIGFIILLSLQIINYSVLKDSEKFCTNGKSIYLSKIEKNSQDLWDDIIKLTINNTNVNIF